MNLIADLKRKDIKLPEDKKAITYVILAIFLGNFGIHNFYAANKEKAKAQLIMGIVGLVCCCFPLTIISLVTAWIDIATLIEANRSSK